MAANRFATVLHRNTHKMVVVLVYAALEWTLIALLLLNALFSYLIAKFAALFGLAPPCIFCSRVDHVLEPGKSHLDLLCGSHAAEVSRLGYCSRHRKLAEARDMCGDCSSSRPSEADRTIALISWMKRSEAGEKDLRCSCCDATIESGLYSPYLLLKPSWSVLEITQKGNLVGGIEEISEGLDNGEPLGREGKEEDRVVSLDSGDRGHEWEGEKDGVQVEGECKTGPPIPISEPEQEDTTPPRVLMENAFFEVLALHSEGIVDEARLVPVEMADFATLIENPVAFRPQGKDHGELGNNQLEIESTERIASSEPIEEVKDRGSTQIPEMVDVVEEQPSAPLTEKSSENCSDCHQCPQDGVNVEAEALVGADDLVEDQASDNCDMSIGSETCDEEQIDRTHVNESVPLSVEVVVHCSENYNETMERDQAIETEPIETNTRGVDHLSISPELNEAEDERMPETPTSIEGIHALHKRFFFERRETGTESLDGSVASEMEAVETLTVDRLKSALRAERKALSALYEEFEEERSASAIAANQTMAMITRLQEEKAATQMEALQYQRMMEEQSEYDQEALQLLNELMMKREKEKRDLEKELEVYRKKVLLYEAKERRKMARSKANGRNGSSSASSSAEDSDDQSFGFHEGGESFDSLNESNQNTPTDAVLGSGAASPNAKHLVTLDESLADFEEERLSILEQLKALEMKLFTLKDEEPSYGLEATEHFSEENGHGLNGYYEATSNEENGIADDFPHDLDTDGKLHSNRRSMDCRGKRLLPLFDAISMDDEEETDATPESFSKSTIDHQKLAIAEEVDNVYERLHSLEADREFFRHCISSLKKGGQGMGLLQEILQHLRDLRNVELRVRNAGDELASLSA